MSKLDKDGIVKVIRGVFTSKRGGPDIMSLRGALTEESECGLGFDYCRGGVIHKDKATDTLYIQYIKDGVSTVKTVADFDQNGA